MTKLVELVREWQDARKPVGLAAPGVGIAESFQAAVRRMVAAEDALATFDLHGPASGALVGQTAPTESTGAYAALSALAVCRDYAHEQQQRAESAETTLHQTPGVTETPKPIGRLPASWGKFQPAAVPSWTERGDA